MYRWALIIPLLLLTGCFVSKEPLIIPAAASWPFKDGQVVTAFANCALVWETADKCEGRREGYLREGTSGRFKRTSAGYVFETIPANPEISKEPLVLFKDIGDGYHLMQGEVTRPGADYRQEYLLTRFEGTSVYLFTFMCEKGDVPTVGKGGVERIPRICRMDDLRKLTSIFRRRIEAGAVPVGKWELER